MGTDFIRPALPEKSDLSEKSCHKPFVSIGLFGWKTLLGDFSGKAHPSESVASVPIRVPSLHPAQFTPSTPRSDRSPRKDWLNESSAALVAQ